MLAAIEWNKIGELLWVAPVAGIAVALSFSLLVVGAARSGEARRAGALPAAAAYALLAAVSAVAFAGVVVEGVRIIIVK